ncbi:MAG: hypothetical protein KGI54_15365 [Pseudomonadota bacterium]|nr:hypothetical protein [Pseudomonadota bacterium]
MFNGQKACLNAAQAIVSAVKADNNQNSFWPEMSVKAICVPEGMHQ